MTTLEVLERGLERVKRGWTQGMFAANEAGQPCHTGLGGATAWCASGAVQTASLHEWRAALDALERHVPAGASNQGDVLVYYNDAPERTQADIIALFERAIAAEKARA